MNEHDDMPPEEILYCEAKLALGNGDTTAARTLLEQCPATYKNVSRYLRQLDTYDRLCTGGVIERRDTTDVREHLAEVLGEDTLSSSVIKYADALLHHGYNLRSLSTLTMASMEECMEHASMTDGHRFLFSKVVSARTPCMEYTFMTALRSLERCSRVAKCVKETIPDDLPKNMIMANMMRDEDDDRGVTSDDETAGD
jgi:hypothetical protein